MNNEKTVYKIGGVDITDIKQFNLKIINDHITSF